MGYTEVQKGHLLDDRGYKFLKSLRKPRPLARGEEPLHKEYSLYTETVGFLGYHNSRTGELKDLIKLSELGVNTLENERMLRSPIRRFLRTLDCKML